MEFFQNLGVALASNCLHLSLAMGNKKHFFKLVARLREKSIRKPTLGSFCGTNFESHDFQRMDFFSTSPNITKNVRTSTIMKDFEKCHQTLPIPRIFKYNDYSNAI